MQHNQWNVARISASDLTDNDAGFTADAELTNSWLMHGSVTWHRFIPVFDDRASRGGPVLRRVPYTDASLELDGDPRLRLLPSLGAYAWRAHGAQSWGFGVDPSLAFRLSRSLTGTIAPHFEHNSDNNQWVDNLIAADGSDTAYTFGHIDQNTVSLTARVDYTLSPRLSLQVYAQPFVSSGTYTDWRELTDGRNANYGLRFRSYGTPGGRERVQLRRRRIPVERGAALGVSRGLRDLRGVDAGAQLRERRLRVRRLRRARAAPATCTPSIRTTPFSSRPRTGSACENGSPLTIFPAS